MASQYSSILKEVRSLLVEPVPRFWTDVELLGHAGRAAKDLWRDTVNLKQEHYLTVNTTDVTYPSSSDRLAGLPQDVHKIYMIEPRDVSINSNDHGLAFKPLDFNHERFQLSRSMDPVDPSNTVIYYCITSQGAPVNAPTILCAPKVTALVPISFSYIPTLEPLTSPDAFVPIPGEADMAIIAWTVAYARAKERDDRAPDAEWLTIYATEKEHILESLGVRQYQEPVLVDGLFQDYWG